MVGLQARVFRQLVETEQPHGAGPEMRPRQGEGEIAILHRHRPGGEVHRVAARPGFLFIQAAQQTRCEGHREHLVHRDIDPLSAAARQPVQQGAQNGTKRQCAGLIGGLVPARFQRLPVGQPVDRGPSRKRVGGELIAGPVRPAAAQPMRGDHHMNRTAGVEAVDPGAVCRAGRRAVDNDFGRRKPFRPRRVSRFQIEAFAVGKRGQRRNRPAVIVERANRTKRVRFPRGNGGTGIGQQPRAPRAGKAGGKIEDPQAL